MNKYMLYLAGVISENQLLDNERLTLSGSLVSREKVEDHKKIEKIFNLINAEILPHIHDEGTKKILTNIIHQLVPILQD